MTNESPTKYPTPHPVTRRFARLFRRRPTAAETTRAHLMAAGTEMAAAFERSARQIEDLRAAREEATRWKRYADEYATDRDTARSETAQLLAWLAALHPSTAVITSEDGWHLLYLVAGGWQMAWPIRPDDLHLFRHVTVVEPSDPRAQWDGHGTEQKYQRVRNHVRLLALAGLAADGALTPVTDGPAATVHALQAEAVTPEVRSA
ncbi:hypothetical protein ACF1BS_14865 [Streptomyces sp. NPDC014748]|uniref:hypothetical protein n=1 Tax=Streptomyces sp. NPDC014748 TaxID=3364905 RepID=UPI003701AD21